MEPGEILKNIFCMFSVKKTKLISEVNPMFNHEGESMVNQWIGILFFTKELLFLICFLKCLLPYWMLFTRVIREKRSFAIKRQ